VSVAARTFPSRFENRSCEIARSCSGMAKLRSRRPPSGGFTSRWRALQKSVRVVGTTSDSTIRVPSGTRDRLNALARRLGSPASEVVAELVREADDRVLLDTCDGRSRPMAGDSQTRHVRAPVNTPGP
jgi:hypothetical protein